MKLTTTRKVVFGLGLFLLATAAHAQASRTWVSGVGDDANPCSRTAPCKTFAGAISKTAAKGVINVLDPGGFGTVTITKSITIDGGGIIGNILSAGVNGVIVNAAASDVVRLKNISIEGFGTGLDGVRFLAGGALYLDNVKIQDMSANGVKFQPTGASRLIISDSVISNVAGAGVHVLPGLAGSARVSIENSRIYENGHGIKVEDRGTAAVRGSLVAANLNSGVNAVSTSAAAYVSIEGCQLSNNGVTNAASAAVKGSGALATLVISDNQITGNYNGMSALAGSDVLSFGNNRVSGNVSDGNPTAPALTTR